VIGRVQGYCPMGCGETLFLASGGHVTCSLIGCPNPCAADAVLGDRETEHVVVIREEGFTVQHPLRERLKGELFDCGLHSYLTNLGGPPAKPGRYRARPDGDQWSFEELPAPEVDARRLAAMTTADLEGGTDGE